MLLRVPASWALLFCVLSCSRAPGGAVVVYTSVDEIYALEVFAAFTRETGVAVRPLFDAESAKTLGLVHRIAAERGDPQADVFWNGECARTALLKSQGLLEPYRSPSAEGIGPEWRDPDGAWTGFGARARVIVYNTERVKEPPRTLEELAGPAWKDRVAMANPLFGTTAAHVAALAQARGEEGALRLLSALRANGLRVVGGNSHVVDLVASGGRDAGITDTDDVWVRKEQGRPVAMVYPEDGTLAIPNSVALVKGAPRAARGRAFIDFLLRKETEAMLARGRSRQMPVRADVDAPSDVPRLPSLRTMKVDWSRLAAAEPFVARVKGLFDL
jgi:iron(III) transport system substrate-binding protein